MIRRETPLLSEDQARRIAQAVAVATCLLVVIALAFRVTGLFEVVFLACFLINGAILSLAVRKPRLVMWVLQLIAIVLVAGGFLVAPYRTFL